MKGSELKEILRREGVVFIHLAEELGVSQQNLSAAFTRDDVKSGLLEKIAKILNKPIGYLYGECEAGASAQAGANAQASPDSAAILELLKIKDEQLLVSMQQTSKAQEQMDRVLDVLTRQTPPQPVTLPVVSTVSTEQMGVAVPRSGKRRPLTSALRTAKLASKTGTVSLPSLTPKKDL